MKKVRITYREMATEIWLYSTKYAMNRGHKNKAGYVKQNSYEAHCLFSTETEIAYIFLYSEDSEILDSLAHEAYHAVTRHNELSVPMKRQCSCQKEEDTAKHIGVLVHLGYDFLTNVGGVKHE